MDASLHGLLDHAFIVEANLVDSYSPASRIEEIRRLLPDEAKKHINWEEVIRLDSMLPLTDSYHQIFHNNIEYLDRTLWMMIISLSYPNRIT